MLQADALALPIRPLFQAGRQALLPVVNVWRRTETGGAPPARRDDREYRE